MKVGSAKVFCPHLGVLSVSWDPGKLRQLPTALVSSAMDHADLRMNVFLFSPLFKRMCLVTKASMFCVNLEIPVNVHILHMQKIVNTSSVCPHLPAWKIKTFNEYNSNHVMLLVQSELQWPLIDPSRTSFLHGNQPRNCVYVYIGACWHAIKLF